MVATVRQARKGIDRVASNVRHVQRQVRFFKAGEKRKKKMNKKRREGSKGRKENSHRDRGIERRSMKHRWNNKDETEQVVTK